MIKFPKTTFYGFSADATYDKHFEKIFQQKGTIYFSNFSHYIDRIEGTNCKPLDGHWNHLVNRVAGNILSELITGHEEMKKRKTHN